MAGSFVETLLPCSSSSPLNHPNSPFFSSTVTPNCSAELLLLLLPRITITIMGFLSFTNIIKNKIKKSSKSGNNSSMSCSSSSSSFSEPSTSPRSVLSNSPLRRGPDGKVSRGDLTLALRRLGPLSDESELDVVLSEVDHLGDGRVCVEEVCCSSSSGEEEEIRAAFAVYDIDGDGRISAEELREIMVRLGDAACSVEECRRMIDVVDRDGDGFVGLGDFAWMMSAR